MARWYAIPGVVISFLASVTGRMRLPLIPALFWLVAAGLCAKACSHIAVAKGRNPLLGYLGLLTVPGVIIASLLRDLHPEEAAEVLEALEAAQCTGGGAPTEEEGAS